MTCKAELLPQISTMHKIGALGFCSVLSVGLILLAAETADARQVIRDDANTS